MESNKTRNILLSCAVILVIACVCLGVILVGGLGVSLFRPLSLNQAEAELPTPIEQTEVPSASMETEEFIPEIDLPTPNEDTEVPITPTVTEEVMPDASDAEPLPDEIADVVFDIEGQVSQIRGLTLQQPVPRVMMSPDELEDIVVNEFFAEYTDEDARQDVLVLSLLGLISADYDLKSLYNDLYSEQISGFYDSETQEIYIVQGTTFGGNEKLTYAHEFTHVLQDQTYGFDEGLGYNEEACDIDSERCAAIQSLIEGDASLTEILWFQTHATRADTLDILQTFTDLESPIFDSAPPFIQADLYFPYEKGFAFVEHLHKNGGYQAVDAAYVDLPLSTEQILHPERYPEDQPILVNLPNLESVLGDEWMLFDQNVMGEWYTYLILGQSYQEVFRIPEDQAKEAAEGWGGDAYAFYLNQSTDDVIFILDMVWDTDLDADEFVVALTSYAHNRWDANEQSIMGNPTWQGQDGTVVLLQDGDRALWIVAPSETLAERILLELQ
jgi:hypothetical protein